MRTNSKIEIQIEISETPMDPSGWESSEDMLATFVARAIAAEHPEWFGKMHSEEVTAESASVNEPRTNEIQVDEGIK